MMKAEIASKSRTIKRQPGILLRCGDVEVGIEKWHHLIGHPRDLQLFLPAIWFHAVAALRKYLPWRSGRQGSYRIVGIPGLVPPPAAQTLRSPVVPVIRPYR